MKKRKRRINSKVRDPEVEVAFERLYSRLFSEVMEGGQREKWRYDPLDSKYPTIDGILRRTTKTPSKMEGGQLKAKERFVWTEEFVLLQLKGTRTDQKPNNYKSLKDELRRCEEKINDIARSANVLLIGLVVDEKQRKIKEAYFAAPTTWLANGGVKKNRPVKRKDLRKMIGKMLNALGRRDDTAPFAVEHIPQTFTVRPKPQETFYFNKGADGWYSVTNGIIAGRKISINWTLPRPTAKITISKIAGTASIEAIPVTLPHPPYREIPNQRHPVGDQWAPPKTLQDGSDVYWVIQIRFEAEATIKIEALLAP